MNSKIEGGVALYITDNKSGVFYYWLPVLYTPLSFHLLTPKSKRRANYFTSLINLTGMWLYYLETPPKAECRGV